MTKANLQNANKDDPGDSSAGEKYFSLPPPPMKTSAIPRWAYRMEMPTSDFNELGAEGWDLCAVLHNGMAVFKRPLREQRDCPDLNQDKEELERAMRAYEVARGIIE